MDQVCFRLPDGVAVPATMPGELLRLRSAEVEALSEMLQAFACGEESAALAFGQLSRHAAGAAARDALAVIADEEAGHEGLLRGLRAALPDPAPNRELRLALIRFYSGLAFDDPGRHLAGIAALDSGVCTVVAAILRRPAPLAQESHVAAVFSRIRREEAGHVRLSRTLARELGSRAALDQVAEQTRHGLVEVLSHRGAAFDTLGVDPDRLFAELRHSPAGLFA